MISGGQSIFYLEPARSGFGQVIVKGCVYHVTKFNLLSPPASRECSAADRHFECIIALI